MTTSCLALLALPPEVALTQMVQDALVSGVVATDLALGSPTATQGLSMALPISIPADTISKPEWNYFGAAVLNYTRLDLTDTFTGIDLAFKVALPTTSDLLAQEMATAFGIVFEEGDYVQEAVNVAPGQIYLFRAASTSTRWKGSVVMTLYPTFGQGA